MARLSTTIVFCVLLFVAGIYIVSPYFAWRWMQIHESVADLPGPFGRIVGGVMRRIPGLGGSDRGAGIIGTSEERDLVLGSFVLFDDDTLNHLLRAGHIGDPEGVRRLLDRWRDPVKERDPLAQALYIRARTHLPEAVLTPSLRLASEFRIDIRFPFADAEVVQWLERLPADYRLDGGTGKKLHREALGEWIPASVLLRPKRSLADSVRRWMRGPGKERVDDWLLGPNAWMPSVLDSVCVRRVIDETCKGRGATERLVLLIQLELWAREAFLGGTR